MEVLFEGTGAMFPVAIACLISVFIAIIVDLISGIRKAKESGQKIRSNPLSRTITKFVIYEGAVIIATTIDYMLHFSHLSDKCFGLRRRYFQHPRKGRRKDPPPL